jgi:hypothetical protein
MPRHLPLPSTTQGLTSLRYTWSVGEGLECQDRNVRLLVLHTHIFHYNRPSPFTGYPTITSLACDNSEPTWETRVSRTLLARNRSYRVYKRSRRRYHHCRGCHGIAWQAITNDDRLIDFLSGRWEEGGCRLRLDAVRFGLVPDLLSNESKTRSPRCPWIYPFELFANSGSKPMCNIDFASL